MPFFHTVGVGKPEKKSSRTSLETVRQMCGFSKYFSVLDYYLIFSISTSNSNRENKTLEKMINQ